MKAVNTFSFGPFWALSVSVLCAMCGECKEKSWKCQSEILEPVKYMGATMSPMKVARAATHSKQTEQYKYAQMRWVNVTQCIRFESRKLHLIYTIHTYILCKWMSMCVGDERFIKNRLTLNEHCCNLRAPLFVVFIIIINFLWVLRLCVRSCTLAKKEANWCALDKRITMCEKMEFTCTVWIACSVFISVSEWCTNQWSAAAAAAPYTLFPYFN